MNVFYRYPDPNKIEIDEADFMLKLRNFRRALRNRPSWSDFLLLAPAWAILLTSDFQNIGLFSGQHLKGAYFALISIGTFVVIGGFFGNIKFFHRIWLAIVSQLFRDDHKPEKLIEDIKSNSRELKR